MYPKTLTLTFLLGLTCPFLSIAQAIDIHPWFVKLKAAQHDTDKVKIYYAISRYYWNKDPDSALLFAEQGLAIAGKTHYETGMALAFLSKGVAYGVKGQYPEALQCHLQALRISEKLGMLGLTGNNYTNIGNVYAAMKDYPRSLEYYRLALQIAEDDKLDSTRKGVAALLINMAEIYKDNGKFDSAIDYNMRAIQITELAHDSMDLSVALLNMGDDYVKIKQPDKALRSMARALHISEKIDDREGIAWAYNSMAEAYHLLEKHHTSIRYAGMSLKMAEELPIPELTKASCHSLYASYQGLHQFDSALYYRNREIALNDSLYTLEKEKQVKNLQSDYELEKKQHQIELLNKDKIIRENEMARGRVMGILYIVLAVLLGLGCFLLYRSNAHKKRLNHMLEGHNEEIERQNKQLEELNMVKNKLLSIIGHDLRSPIATLQGFVDLLQQSALSAEQVRHFSKQMSENLVGTSHLLNNLLYWAKSQMEGMQVNAGNIDLRALIGQNKRLAQGRATEKKVTLLTEDGMPPLVAYADEIMVDLVIRNLVENAIKFSRPGDTVSLSAHIADQHIFVTIKDTGLGIAAADAPKIFHPSISHSTMGTAREKGSGLGLALCRELIEKNRGTIWFESEPGNGTSFIFTLPLAGSGN